MYRQHLARCLVTLFFLSIVPAVCSAAWNASQNKWTLGPNEAVFYQQPTCKGTPYLVVSAGSEFMHLSDVKILPNAGNWNDRIHCVDVGEKVTATICSGPNLSGSCLTLGPGMNDLAGTRCNGQGTSLKVDYK